MEKKSLVLTLLGVCLWASLVGGAVGQNATNVYATVAPYYAQIINWDYNAAHVFCAEWDAGKPLEWRKHYGWAAFCGPVGPTGRDACGRCLKVTNTETGDEQIVRIVDKCGSGALELDYNVFNMLDTNGHGMARGHLIVDYEFVMCCY